MLVCFYCYSMIAFIREAKTNTGFAGLGSVGKYLRATEHQDMIAKIVQAFFLKLSQIYT